MKKILATFLAIVMLFSVMSICAGAESATTYTGLATVQIPETYTFNPENFSFDLTINNKKIGALDGASDDFEFTIGTIQTIDGIVYDEATPESFFEVFTAEGFAGAAFTVEFTVKFASADVFGELEYNLIVKGFSAPLDVGIDLGGLLGDATPDLSANLPKDIVITDVIPGLPDIDISTLTVLGRPEKTDYYDTDNFDPTGTKLSFKLTNGTEGTFTYNADNAHMFKFSPSIADKLTCYDSEVATFLNGNLVMYTPITVNHKWSDGYVNITTYKYTESKPGYHAIVCEGCGETHDAQPHVVNEDNWTYNNDHTFVANGTESNTCTECGTEVIRDTFGTAGFNSTFGDMHFVKVIFEYINTLLRFIGAATY